MKQTLKKLTKHSFYKALAVTLFFAIFYIFSNTELVRNKVEDLGFDVLNKAFSYKVEAPPNAPKVLLFGFDNAYMKEKNLFDKDNRTNYGYNLPRSHIAKFISQLDDVCDVLKNDEHKPLPKALFIDIDISFASNSDGNLSEDDEMLIKVLKNKSREYTIVFPKIRTVNFIEHYKDEIIQELIAQKKIVFGTVGLTVSKDNATRRYLAYKEIHNLDGETNTTYPNVNIILWKLSQNRELNISQVKNFKEKDIICNRIMIKNYIENNVTNIPTIKSNWSNHTKYSALYHYEAPEYYYSDAIVVLGSTFQNNEDSFEVLNVFSNLNMYGVELQVQTLMTLFYFDGQLKKMHPISTHLWVFYLVFMIDLMVSLLLLALKKQESKWSYMGAVGVLVVVMGYIAYLFLEQGVWFNWFVPTVLFQLFDIFM